MIKQPTYEPINKDINTSFVAIAKTIVNRGGTTAQKPTSMQHTSIMPKAKNEGPGHSLRRSALPPEKLRRTGNDDREVCAYGYSIRHRREIAMCNT
jgi:hypothetical protein